MILKKEKISAIKVVLKCEKCGAVDSVIASYEGDIRRSIIIAEWNASGTRCPACVRRGYDGEIERVDEWDS